MMEDGTFICFPSIKSEPGFLAGVADEHWFVGFLTPANTHLASIPTLHFYPANLEPIVFGIGRCEPYDLP
jgi:hypothetical protein